MSPAAPFDAPVHPDAFDIPRLREGLRPFHLHWFEELSSTNTEAAQLRRRGDLFAPSVVLAGRQTAGRGRGEHSWWSGPGCLTVTFVLPAEAQPQPHRVPLIAGLAVRKAAAEAVAAAGGAADAIQLKWPNDVVVCADGPADGPLRKVAGLLCERVHGTDLLGVGLNVNLDPAGAPEGLRGQIASLSQLAGRPLDLTDTLIAVARHLHAALSGGADATAAARDASFAAVLREYDSRHALNGRFLDVITGAGAPPVGGHCEGLDEVGRLLLRSGTTLHRVIAGQVVLRHRA